MQKKTKKIIMLTILLLIILAIILLIQNTTKQMPQPLTEQAKANYTTQIGNQTYDITHAVLEPNEITPTISAGMIPIKWNGTNFVITTFDDTNWYDYSIGQPAYIMLNDGYYQSELIQNMQGKELAENSVGNDAIVVPNVTDNNPTIYMYIPRFAYNTQGEILYIKQGCSVAGTYAIPEIFVYQTEKRDFSLAGIWVEYTPLASTSTVNTKISNMQGENNKYGFIANTIGVNANNEPSYKTAIETYNKYIANTVGVGVPDDPSSTEHLNTVGNDALVVPQINEPTNPNRTILKITNTNQLEPIKANAYYNTEEEKIKIEVTYRTNAITKILDSKGNILSEISTTADTGDEIIGNKTYKYIIIDNLGNIKEITTTVTGLDIYIIENEDDLKLFRDAVNAGKTTTSTKAYQIADVKMNEGKYTINEETGDITFADDAEKWVPIGNSNTGYSGTYDGQGHKISGIYINATADNQGLFGYINNSTIENLKLVKSYINGKNNVGGIIGCVNGRTSVINCCNEAVVIASLHKVGGIIGYVNGTASAYCTINKSLNKGIVSARGNYAGGIIGFSNYTIINNCYNIATITSDRECGGIVGYNASGYLSNCYNIGSIYVGMIDVNTSSAGGIVGSNMYGTINSCYNIGFVRGYQCIGGVVGQNGRTNSDTKYSYIKNCVNATEKITGTRLIGGICGYMPSSYARINTSSYLKTNSSLYGIGAMRNSNNVTQYNSNTGCSIYTSIESMPTVLSVINSDNAFVEDTAGINNGYPILAWQVETTE